MSEEVVTTSDKTTDMLAAKADDLDETTPRSSLDTIPKVLDTLESNPLSKEEEQHGALAV